MSMEVAFLIGTDDSILYEHEPANRSSVALPDSRDLWEVIWENRDKLAGIAHSHPGRGLSWPSSTDASTFSAIEAGLGRELQWWICTRESCLLYGKGPGFTTWEESVRGYDALRTVKHHVVNPPWLSRLRELSYGREDHQKLWMVAEQTRRVCMTAPVDDDFPAMVRALDRALHGAADIGGEGGLYELRDVVVKWRDTGYRDPKHQEYTKQVHALLKREGF